MEKTQIGWVFIIVLLVVETVVIWTMPDLGVVIIITMINLLILSLFYKLTIGVEDRKVRYSLGIGIIRGVYELSEIESCRPVTYFPLGWGIRFRPGVKLYNVSGRKAIELSLKGKKRKVWIGTNRPEELSNYINQKLSDSHERGME